MTDTSDKQNDPLFLRLQLLAKETPELAVTVRFYAAILPLLREAPCPVGTLPLSPEEAREKLSRGEPLLAGLELELDLRRMGELLYSLARAAAGQATTDRLRRGWLAWGRDTQDADIGALARRLVHVLAAQRLNLGALFAAVAAGDGERVAALSRELDLEPGLVWTLARYAFRPTLQGWYRQMAHLISYCDWHHGHCPVCGSAPALGELQDNSQTRHLRCSECGADWPVRRIQCPHCGNEEHQSQQFLYREGEQETMRVELCDRCQGYLKVITSFAPTTPELLPVEELRTLHLDRAAQERGYRLPLAM